MVFSYYIIKVPYSITWHVKKWLGKTDDVVFYCGTELDLEIFAPVQKYLKTLPVVVKDKSLQKKLADRGVKSTLLPSFPKGVVMARHAAYRFPCNAITRICLSHGAYNFKRFASAESHNMLDKYFFTSESDVKNAQKAGIESGVAVGYPKLDKAFDGSITAENQDALSRNLNLDPEKPTLLFTATWDKSGISAIENWYDQLGKFSAYNVLVTTHPWASSEIVDVIQKTDGVKYIQGYDVLPYIMLADLCIGDSSSILGECCALDKPMITFQVPVNKRTVPHVMDMIRSVSWQVETADELLELLPQALANPEEHKDARIQANNMMFDELDGKAGLRAAEVILGYFPELALEKERG